MSCSSKLSNLEGREPPDFMAGGSKVQVAQHWDWHLKGAVVWGSALSLRGLC